MGALGYKQIARKKKDAVAFLGYSSSDKGYAKYEGVADRYVKFTEEHQLLDKETWRRFVEVFRHDSDDFDRGWRCEFWGKMMRGGCLTYMYSGTEELYRALLFAVEDMLTAQRADGRFSTYSEEMQFSGWDLWGRKYVMTGFMHFLKICRDEGLKERIMTALMAHADHIVKHVGNGRGQVHIGLASDHWLGMNSCTILEPFMELYRLTGKASYLRFAKYIISTGGTCGDLIINAALRGAIGSFKRDQFDQYIGFLNRNMDRDGKGGDNLIEIALGRKFKPYEYPVTKAYEMMSFFEGVLAYYEMSGEKKYLDAVVSFMDDVKETDITVIGCSGCTHELFDHSALKQTEYSEIIMQETCVTVTWIRIISRLYALTGNPKYIDCVERSAYNALYGSANTEGLPQTRRAENGTFETLDPMPFDSYSPLRANKRDKGVGGLKKFEFGGYYGCCACIASAGTALVPRIATAVTARGFAINSFLTGTAKGKAPNGNEVTLTSLTTYPRGGEYTLTVGVDEPTAFTLDLRLPEWAEGAAVKVSGRKINATPGAYTAIKRVWKRGDTVEVEIPLKVRFERVGERVALVRGCIVLARDEAKSNVGIDAPIRLEGDFESVCPEGCEIVRVIHGGEVFTDYSSAGKRWRSDKCRVNVWFDVEE